MKIKVGDRIKHKHIETSFIAKENDVRWLEGNPEYWHYWEIIIDGNDILKKLINEI